MHSPSHVLVEVGLALAIVYILFVKKSYDPSKKWVGVHALRKCTAQFETVCGHRGLMRDCCNLFGVSVTMPVRLPFVYRRVQGIWCSCSRGVEREGEGRADR